MARLSAREAVSIATELVQLQAHLDALRAFARGPGMGENIVRAIARLADPIENRLVALLSATPLEQPAMTLHALPPKLPGHDPKAWDAFRLAHPGNKFHDLWELPASLQQEIAFEILWRAPEEVRDAVIAHLTAKS